jgi:4-amino-4-deoxy-L-arabinose transferase-like glycosyltransferase
VAAIAALLLVRNLLAPAHPTAGSILIARGGPVIIGFQGLAGDATLTVAGHTLSGHGLVKDRIVLPAGPAPFELRGDARLVWSPVGRRGDPEYVPASSLSQDPPERASFPAWAGAAPLDGVIASLILLVIVGSILYAARDRLRAVPRDHYLAMGAVLAGALLARWIDLSGHGQTWDEDVNWAAGRNYITNILSLDFHARSWIWNYEHPPVMKYLEGIGAQFADGFGPARALSSVWTALGCALLVPIGARLYNLRTGLLAGAIAALLPPLVAHGQIVGHESPTVLLWTLGILLALAGRLTGTGIVIGLATASRFVNGLLGVLCLAIVAIEHRDQLRPPAWRLPSRVLVMFWQLVRVLVTFWQLPVLALVTFYVVWPRLWLDPVGALAESLHKLSQTHSPEPFLGAVTAHPGPHYFLVYLVATLPVGVLLGLFLWPRRDRATLVTALWLVIPLAVVVSPVRQDGVRYVMPSVVALAMCSAAGWERLASCFRARRAWRAYWAVLAALVIYLAVTLVRIHPYYLDYFAEQVGGTGTVAAHGWMETAWWGEGVDRAVDYVNDHAAAGAHVYRDCIEPAHLAWFRQDLWTPMVRIPAQADWIVTYAPETHQCAIPAGYRRVFAVDADGATLAEVWQR